MGLPGMCSLPITYLAGQQYNILCYKPNACSDGQISACKNCWLKLDQMQIQGAKRLPLSFPCYTNCAGVQHNADKWGLGSEFGHPTYTAIKIQNSNKRFFGWSYPTKTLKNSGKEKKKKKSNKDFPLIIRKTKLIFFPIQNRFVKVSKTLLQL